MLQDNIITKYDETINFDMAKTMQDARYMYMDKLSKDILHFDEVHCYNESKF